MERAPKTTPPSWGPCVQPPPGRSGPPDPWRPPSHLHWASGHRCVLRIVCEAQSDRGGRLFSAKALPSTPFPRRAGPQKHRGKRGASQGRRLAVLCRRSREDVLSPRGHRGFSESLTRGQFRGEGRGQGWGPGCVSGRGGQAGALRPRSRRARGLRGRRWRGESVVFRWVLLSPRPPSTRAASARNPAANAPAAPHTRSRLDLSSR